MGKVVVAPDEVLRSVAYKKDLSAWLRRVPLSRREVIEAGTSVLYAHDERGGTITAADGEAIVVSPGIFDEVHGEDGSAVWISEQRRNRAPQRKFARRLRPRLRLYDAIGILSGCAVTEDRRRAEVAEMRELLRRFNRVWRARYVHEVRKLRKAHEERPVLLYGYAVRRLRLRFRAELEHWEVQQ